MAGKLHPKDEPRRRMATAPLDRLKSRGYLNVYELTAADELIASYHMATGQQVSRDADLGIPRGETRPDAADDSAARRSDLLSTYRQWKADLLGNRALEITTGVLFGETPLRDLEQHWHMRNGSALTHLLTGLRHFAALRGNVPRGVRGWKFERQGETA